MPPQPNVPSVPRRQVAHILSRLHKESGLYIKDVAEQINLHHTTVSKMLKGEPCNLKPIYIDKLCEIYRVGPALKRELKALAAEAEGARGWWHDIGDVESTTQLSTFIALERSATAFFVYQNARIPGLLQSEDYARSLLSTSPDTEPENVERYVALRMSRQTLLTESKPKLDVILDECVLHRTLADPVMAKRQLNQIVATSKLPNVRFRLVPFDVGLYHGTDTGPFMILEFGGAIGIEPEPPVVYVESGVGSTLYFDKTDQVTRYRRSWADIEKSALSVSKTRAHLSKIAKELPR
ncbi:Scr1 family TA system antitoxin-like transcriptional regulator [Nocardia terpenica]|uniref:Uncharacterized protein n=1 Tax=Nocardia terpenica TaxID=455432 RepID=A0A291RHF7_9NOCA|nr:Scr1 family TA system antitoxin-like transcriptional regulator [Nocardia terpenica]ATL66564.1 hypothetical protein CRH09_10445 [Nocardia terpenica]